MNRSFQCDLMSIEVADEPSPLLKTTDPERDEINILIK